MHFAVEGADIGITLRRLDVHDHIHRPEREWEALGISLNKGAAAREALPSAHRNGTSRQVHAHNTARPEELVEDRRSAAAAAPDIEDPASVDRATADDFQNELDGKLVDEVLWKRHDCALIDARDRCVAKIQEQREAAELGAVERSVDVVEEQPARSLRVTGIARLFTRNTRRRCFVRRNRRSRLEQVLHQPAPVGRQFAQAILELTHERRSSGAFKPSFLEMKWVNVRIVGYLKRSMTETSTFSCAVSRR